MRARGTRPVTALILLALLAASPAFAVGATDAGTDSTRLLLTLDAPLTPGDRADLAARGVLVERAYAVAPAVLARVPAGTELADLPVFVVAAKPPQPLEPHLNLATRLTRATGAAGAPGLGVTGAGVGVAVVDSGVDATHPDLEGRVVRNVRHVDGRFVDAPGDATGHGTHVASIAAGNGAASDGALRGVAPGAHVVGVDISGAFDTAAAMDAFDWIYRNKDDADIRVVVNAWGRQQGGVERFDPDDALVRAADRLVREGVVVVFSASNHGPRESSLSLDAQNPRVLTVGATDAAGVLAAYSSRGPAVLPDGSAADWVKPDVLAPGTAVTAARASSVPPEDALGRLPEGAVTEDALRYRDLTGTSQAAPHVAGVVALMLEADPALTPADVTNALRETAIRVTEDGAPDHASGFGLVDARDAVALARGEAPDRGNVLVAGGNESYHARGRFIGDGTGGVRLEPTVGVGGSADLLDVDVPVKPGTTALAFDLRWTPPDAGLTAYLTNGDVTLGPWSTSDADGSARVIRGQAPPDELDPGMWRLLARADDGTDLEYTADVRVTVAGDAARAGPLDPRYRLPDAPPDTLAAWWRGQWDAGTVWARAASAAAAEKPLAAAAGVLGVSAMIGGVLGIAGRVRARE